MTRIFVTNRMDEIGYMVHPIHLHTVVDGAEELVIVDVDGVVTVNEVGVTVTKRGKSGTVPVSRGDQTVVALSTGIVVIHGY